jgi:DNA-directed RNA polymerase specialized sigma24 family protein
LIDHARRKKAARHGGNSAHVPAEDDLIEYAVPGHSPEQLLDLNDALDRFSQVDAAKAKLVELVFFAGLSLDEAADSLAISRATAYRYWTFSRAWLHDAIQGHNSTDATGTQNGAGISTIGSWNPS